MAQVIKEIQLEVSKPNFIQAIVAKQFDSKSRWLRVQLVDNGEKITVADTSAVTINARRSDGGEKKFAGSVDKGKGTVLVPLSAWMLQLEGTVKSDVSVTDTSGRILTTTNFTIEVERASCQDSGVSEDDANIDILTQLILDVQSIKPDTTYNPESTNAQSGKAVAEALANVKIDVDDTITENGTNPVSGGAVKSYVDGSVASVKATVEDVSSILDRSINLYNKNTNTEGSYLDANNNIVNSNAHSYTDYVYLTAGTYYVKGFADLSPIKLPQQFQRILRYDVNKTFKGAVNFTVGSFTMEYDGFVRFSGSTSYMLGIVLSKDTEATEYVPYKKEIKSSYFPIDHTYNPESKNAISGEGVAQALTQVEIDVDSEMSDVSTNPVQNKVVKKYIDDVTQGETSKINPQDINGTVVVGSLTPFIELVKENTSFTVIKNVVSYTLRDGWNTYILKIPEVGTYSAYGSGKIFNICCVAEDKSTVTVGITTDSSKRDIKVDENSKYFLIATSNANFKYLLINKGTNTSISYEYRLPDTFNDYANKYGEIFPDNVQGVKNVGDLIGRAKLLMGDNTFSYTNGLFKYITDTTNLQNVYTLKLTEERNYSITTKNIVKLLLLDENFIPIDGTFAFINKATNYKIACGDSAKYLLFTMIKGDEANYHISVGDTAYEKPIYEGFGGSDGSSSFDYTKYNLPILYINGDTSQLLPAQDKPEGTFTYKYKDKEGSCTLKYQGSSSINYPKKNYTIKFDNKFEAKEGWGTQKKYCLKANYIDFSHSRNVVSAKLWGQVVKSRANVDTHLANLVNGGAVDGFPIMVVINDKYQGLYTFNIPKDKWMFNVEDGDSCLVLPVDGYSTATDFSALETSLTDDDGKGFEIEYAPDNMTESEILNRLNAFIGAVVNCNKITDKTAKKTDFEANVKPLMDFESFVDYVIFQSLITGSDNGSKNYILTDYYDNGVDKWGITAYDMDSTYGLKWDGKAYLPINNQVNLKVTNNKLLGLIVSLYPEEIKARYETLRTGVMAESNVQLEFYNFTAEIPKAIKDEECKLWSLIPNTDTNNVNQIVNQYILRCKYIDEQASKL